MAHLMIWTRKRTVIAGQVHDEDDWTIFRAGERVGRVYATQLTDPAHAWLWASWFTPAEQGYAASFDAALEEIRRRAG